MDIKEKLELILGNKALTEKLIASIEIFDKTQEVLKKTYLALGRVSEVSMTQKGSGLIPTFLG